MSAVTVVIVGAGGRGRLVYARYAKMFPDEMKVVGVAEFNEQRRILMAQEHELPVNRLFASAEDLFEQDKMADMAFICTQDRDHVRHARMAMEKGYDILLEKPVSADIVECKELLELAGRLGRSVTVCHVLRYAPFYQKIKEIIASGRLGQVISISASENVGYWHQSHSYVRGNWRRSDETSPMILAKCCHDMDILVWLSESRCKKISSLGERAYFNREHAPEGAPEHCMKGCPVKDSCPYDAEKIYLTDEETGFDQIGEGWMQSVIVPAPTREKLEKALYDGPYGRCVFRCDNNVVDHQTVHGQMENGISISFSLCAFSRHCYRTIHVMGTLGELVGELDTEVLEYRPFGKSVEKIRLEVEETISGHGGGDYRMLQDMFGARREGKETITDLAKSMESHFMALAAEQSRLDGGRMIDVKEFVESHV